MAKDNVIQFPTLTEANKLRESMEELEKAIKSNLDDLQQINEEIVQLTVVYEDMLHRLCELTGVKLPPDYHAFGDDDGEMD
jgi:predicted 2-oxoglutarate/Fe(II)-dependent dioxygenase YbiX|tara:strand:+ start:75 stop:317 length:243 start_codon:yes stop_codon:yes gene_type:complete